LPVPGAPANHEPVDDLTQDAAQRAGWGCFWHFRKSTTRILRHPYTDFGFCRGQESTVSGDNKMKWFVQATVAVHASRAAIFSIVVGAG
jgi:hypothetical protein